MKIHLNLDSKLICLVGLITVFAFAASAEDWKQGQAPVDSVNAGERTITLDEVVYRVPHSCRIQRESGVRVPLSQLRGAIQPGVQIVLMSDVDYVRYEAIQKRGGWEMVEITVLEGSVE